MKLIKKRSSVLLALATIPVLILTFGVMQVHAQDPQHTEQKQKKRPNILLILADDMGYSDLGSYGGEINTP
ncbi:MAG: hypothetical protein KAQ85_08920, partial [Thermodesulfovibrionia bacterium]|nr:hypothetical protein [Thermodesulfovibrionia bacterium]